MITIRTAEDFARALSQPPDPELKPLLQAHADRLADYADYDLSDLVMVAIVQPGDDLKDIDQGLGWSLLDSDGAFMHPVELIALHRGWIEVTFILSDDGFGLILYVPLDEQTDKQLLTACKQALIEATQP